MCGPAHACVQMEVEAAPPVTPAEDAAGASAGGKDGHPEGAKEDAKEADKEADKDKEKKKRYRTDPELLAAFRCAFAFRPPGRRHGDTAGAVQQYNSTSLYPAYLPT